ncbi:MAG: hypothetical protein GY698_10855 [Actinomycetia bacterium]|nr:hypothetical protein [Actinomycetes bacterium]
MGGYAPEFHENEAPTSTALVVLDQLLAAHVPAPAIVVDRHWNIVTMNEAAGFLADLVDPSLHPETPVLEVELDLDGRQLRFVTTVTVFGVPLDVGASELAQETFHPADESTRDFLHGRLRT